MRPTKNGIDHRGADWDLMQKGTRTRVSARCRVAIIDMLQRHPTDVDVRAPNGDGLALSGRERNLLIFV